MSISTTSLMMQNLDEHHSARSRAKSWSVDADIEVGDGGDAAFANHVVSSLSWSNLCVHINHGKAGDRKTILDKASGTAIAGEMIALMGPSGSGKTTLLRHLASRKVTPSNATHSGRVMINGIVQPLSVMRDVSGFVEQEDALIGTLTAEETLVFAARLGMPSLNRRQIKGRAAQLIDSFGLSASRFVKVGTPLQKGLSGGQKRRVSVASQLITAPKILFLDEPTSGLDSTASFEVISYLKSATKRYNLIVVASIHQPSTKTFELFDKVCLMSEGSTCYFGPTAQLQPFFQHCQLPVPAYTNPAEHALEAVNTDFIARGTAHGSSIERVRQGWLASSHRVQLDEQLARDSHDGALLKPKQQFTGWKDLPHTTMVLIHRGFLKSMRDVVAYWVRLMMYTGLAIMMGTVWIRLGSSQEAIQPYINALFFASAFMSFMAVAYVPAFLEDRSAYVKEHANGLYGSLAFNLANFLVGLPYLFGIVVVFSVISYWLIGFRESSEAFLTWIMWLYLDLLAAESMVVFFASLFPNFVLCLALVAFANGLWMSVGGFLVSPTILNVFWRYVFHYIDYQAYVFQGMMVNEFADRAYTCGAGCQCSHPSTLASQCRIDGQAILSSYGYAKGQTGKWVGILIAIIATYRLLAGLALWVRQS